jgi:hypothetical protein
VHREQESQRRPRDRPARFLGLGPTANLRLGGSPPSLGPAPTPRHSQNGLVRNDRATSLLVTLATKKLLAVGGRIPGEASPRLLNRSEDQS